MRRDFCIVGASVVALFAGAAEAADYPTTVLSENPIAYFRLTTPTTGSAVNGYTTTYTATTGTGPGAPLAAEPGNTGATFAGNNSNPSTILADPRAYLHLYGKKPRIPAARWGTSRGWRGSDYASRTPT